MARKQPIDNLTYVSLARAKDSIRPILTSVLVTSNAIVASDTHRVHFVEHPNSNPTTEETFSVLIGGEVTGVPGEKGVGLYPEWKRVIPSHRAPDINPDYKGDTSLCLALTIPEAIRLCETAKSTASKAKRTVIVITEDNRLLTRTGSDFEGGAFIRDIGIPAERIRRNPETTGTFEIAINYSYLADALSHGIPPKSQSTIKPAVWITFSGPTRPILVEHAPDGFGRRKAAVMPMRPDLQ